MTTSHGEVNPPEVPVPTPEVPNNTTNMVAEPNVPIVAAPRFREGTDDEEENPRKRLPDELGFREIRRSPESDGTNVPVDQNRGSSDRARSEDIAAGIAARRKVSVRRSSPQSGRPSSSNEGAAPTVGPARSMNPEIRENMPNVFRVWKRRIKYGWTRQGSQSREL